MTDRSADDQVVHAGFMPVGVTRRAATALVVADDTQDK